MAPKAKQRFNFGEAFEELEKITGWFEKEDVDLEEGLEKFERGLELAAKLKGRLNEVENRVEEIREKFSELVENGGADDPRPKDDQPF